VEFASDGDLDHQRRMWLDDVANTRVHQTTKEVPVIRFERDERALLQPLAARPYHSLVLASASALPTQPRELALPPVPKIEVEQRSLAAYSRLARHMTGAAR
jgi:hypothetical protein